jgi:selenocysteine lyase/cysteine desulfurase
LHILAENISDRLGVISFYIDDLHYNLGVKLLNDRFGIQVRGGCSCAGTYGHYLLHVEKEYSNQITCKINQGDLTDKPGWIRMSIHPTMTDSELEYILDGIVELANQHQSWSKEYNYIPKENNFNHLQEKPVTVKGLFEL